MTAYAISALSKPHSLHSHILHCYGLMGLFIATLYHHIDPATPSIWLMSGLGLSLTISLLFLYLRYLSHIPKPNIPIKPTCLVQFLLLWIPSAILLIHNPTGYYLITCIISCYLGMISTIITQSHIFTYTDSNQDSLTQQMLAMTSGLLLGILISQICIHTHWISTLCLTLSSMYALSYSFSPRSKPAPQAHYTKTSSQSIQQTLQKLYQQHPARLQLTTLTWFWLHIGWLGTLSFQNAVYLWPFWLIGFILGLYSCAESRHSPLNESAATLLYGLFATASCLLPLAWLNNGISGYSYNIGPISACIFLGTVAAWLVLPAINQLHLEDETEKNHVIHTIVHGLAIVSLWIGSMIAQQIHTQYAIIGLIIFSTALSFCHRKNASKGPLFLFLSSLIRNTMRILYAVDIHGSYPETTDEPTLVIANHTSLLDVGLIGSLFSEKLIYPIHPFWVNTWGIIEIGSLFADIFPMKPSSPHSMKQVIKAIKSGRRCLIFPEGRISNTGNLMKLYEGAAIISEHTKAKVQTIIIQGGMNHISSRDDGRSKRQLFPKIRLGIHHGIDIHTENIPKQNKKAFIARKMFQSLTDTYVSMSKTQHIHQHMQQIQSQYTDRFIVRDNNWNDMISYRTLINQAHRFKKALQHLPAQSLIAIHLPSSCDMAVAMMGCFFGEHIVLPLNPNHSLEQRLSYLKKYQPTAMVSYEITEKDQPITQICEEQNIPILHPNDCHHQVYFWETIHIHTPADKTPAIIFPNTSQEPIVLSHHNICQQAKQLQQLSNILGHDICYNQIGLHEPLGFHMGFMLPLTAGIPTTLPKEPKKSAATIESIYDHRSSVLIVEHDFLEAAKESIYSTHDTSHIRMIFTPQPSQKEELIEHWIKQCKAEIYPVFCPENSACVISMHHPSYHCSEGYGQLLPCSHYGEHCQYQEGPSTEDIHFTHINAPQIAELQYNTQQKIITGRCQKGYQFPTTVTQDILGFIRPTN